jgi:hypothetical protein
MRVLLHIGSPKTGTTAIQIFFYKYFGNTVAGAQLHYPEIGRVRGAHHGLVSAIMGNRAPVWIAQYDFEDLRKKLAAYRSKSADWTLFSSEVLSGWKFIQCAQFPMLKDLFTGFNVNVVFYIRNQVALAESAYLQFAKTGAYLGSVHGFLQKALPRMGDYETIHGKYEQLFGTGSVKLINYDEVRADVVRPVLDICGVDFESKAAKVNVTLSPLIPLVMQRIAKAQKVRFIGQEAARVQRIIAETLGPLEPLCLLSAEQKNQIRAMFREANARLEKNFGIAFSSYDTDPVPKRVVTEEDIQRAARRVRPWRLGGALRNAVNEARQGDRRRDELA